MLKKTLVAWPVIFIVTVTLSSLTELAFNLIGFELPSQENVRLVRDMIGLNWKFVVLCGYMIIVAPIFEEFVFRFLGFKLLKMRVWAMVASSVLFSAAHYLQQPFPDNAFVALFAFGIMQCYLYKWTRNFWSAAIAHGLFNLTNLLLLPFVE